jgi:putative ABC transport system permease protein
MQSFVFGYSKITLIFRNYLSIAWRQLRKEKMYSAIKLGGFALSIAACFLISLYIVDELSYDRFWPNERRLVDWLIG